MRYFVKLSIPDTNKSIGFYLHRDTPIGTLMLNYASTGSERKQLDYETELAFKMAASAEKNETKDKRS